MRGHQPAPGQPLGLQGGVVTQDRNIGEVAGLKDYYYSLFPSDSAAARFSLEILEVCDVPIDPLAVRWKWAIEQAEAVLDVDGPDGLR